ATDTGCEVVAPLDRRVDATLYKVAGRPARRLDVESCPSPRVAAISHPQGQVDRVLRRADLGTLHEHDLWRVALIDRPHRPRDTHGLAVENAGALRPFEEAKRGSVRWGK